MIGVDVDQRDDEAAVGEASGGALRIRCPVVLRKEQADWETPACGRGAGRAW